MKHQQKKKRSKFMTGILALIIIGTFSYVYYGSTRYEPAPSAIDYFFEAYEGCKKTVKRNLKSPSSADFPSQADYTKTLDQIYNISGYVDSQNAFGAVIRTDYECKVQIVDNGSMWKLIAFEFK